MLCSNQGSQASASDGTLGSQFPRSLHSLQSTTASPSSMAADAAAAASGREAEIEKALLVRIPDFKKQADSLTLGGVRRTLEEDMGLEMYSLDAHKKFIKRCVDKVFSGSDAEDTDNASEKAEVKDQKSSKGVSDVVQPMSGSNKVSPSADEPGTMSSGTGQDKVGARDPASSSDVSEAMIRKAIGKRASYFRENAETLNLQEVRRTLEEDLKLEKKALDAYKSFIKTELDEVLMEPANGATHDSTKESREVADQKTSKGSKRAHQDSDTSEINDSHNEKEDSDEDTKPKKRASEKGKAVKRQKKVTVEKKMTTPKVKKVAKRDSDKSTEEQSGNSAPVYGKKVERLKSIIKSCGMSVGPTVYRRVKQAPESKREACLIKELEGILEKEGLSSNPSEKEIKAVKKRKERAKDLEGIDMSNIITSSRRRSTSSFIPLPPPRIEAESDDDDEDEDEAPDDEEEVNVEGGEEGDDEEAEDHDEEENVEG